MYRYVFGLHYAKLIWYNLMTLLYSGYSNIREKIAMPTC